MIDYFFSNWQWIIASVLMLAIIAGRISNNFSENVLREIEEFVQPLPQPAQTPQSIRQISSSDNASVTDRKNHIWKIIQETSETPDQKINGLVNALANSQVNEQFLELYRLIFQSQLFLVRHINSGGGSMSKLDVEAFFVRLGEENPALKTVKFIDWISFPVKQDLLIADLDKFHTTKKSQDFLIWLIQRPLPDKPPERL